MQNLEQYLICECGQ